MGQFYKTISHFGKRYPVCLRVKWPISFPYLPLLLAHFPLSMFEGQWNQGRTHYMTYCAFFSRNILGFSLIVVSNPDNIFYADLVGTTNITVKILPNVIIVYNRKPFLTNSPEPFLSNTVLKIMDDILLPTFTPVFSWNNFFFLNSHCNFFLTFTDSDTGLRLKKGDKSLPVSKPSQIWNWNSSINWRYS